MPMKKSLLFCLCFLLSGIKAAQGAVVDVAQTKEWLALGHYQEKLLGGYESTIDSLAFFLSTKGKLNPKEELEATIALFQSNDDKTKCLFPARYQFLQKNGLIDTKYPKCAELEKFYDDLRPNGITLLFTDAYMNNPSSLFGHTLLRIDTARKGTQLLAHGANYGAFTRGEENGALYAILGLTGGYFGGFTVKPYYEIINTYNNIENRDIWEFSLDFTPQERDFFVAHLWEVGHAQSRYFFFSRNCSYMLMEMLDAVRPDLRLAQDFPVQVIPLDTIKAVVARKGLVKSIHYRPSRQNKIIFRTQQMNKEEEKAYYQAIENKDYSMNELTEAQKADVVETAYQFVQYQYVAQKLELGDYRKQSFQALKARNKLKESGNFVELKEGKSPVQSHDSMRATLGVGFKNGEAFQEISYRPAYHSLSDDSYGLLRGAEINFLNTVLRHYDHQDKTVLERFDLLGIRSISPINRMFTPISFQVLAGIQRTMDPQTQEEGYLADLTAGGGGTYALRDNIWLFAMGNAKAAYGGFLQRNQYGALGANVGVYADFERWRLLAEAEKYYASAKIGSYQKYKIETSYTLNRNNAIAFNYSYQQNYGEDIEESLLSWRHFFRLF